MIPDSSVPHQGDLFSEPQRGSRFKRPQPGRSSGRKRRVPARTSEQLSLPFGRHRSNGHLQAGQAVGRTTSIASISLSRVRPYLPMGSESFILRLLREVPVEVVPVEARESKHGDFTQEHGKKYGRITVNVCGNRYRFLLTLVHELAHARVAATYRRHVRPHGPEWKDEFSRLLFRLLRYPILPARVRRAVYLHALDPKSTDEYDSELQLALRRYDTVDQRLTVAELREGTRFSLDGRQILRRGRMLRRRIQCYASNGEVYTVLPAARVETVFE